MTTGFLGDETRDGESLPPPPRLIDDALVAHFLSKV